MNDAWSHKHQAQVSVEIVKELRTHYMKNMESGPPPKKVHPSPLFDLLPKDAHTANHPF